MKKLDPKGFSVVEVVIVIVVIGLIGGLGWYIKDRSTPKKTAPVSTSNSPTPASLKESTASKEYLTTTKEFKSKIGYSITIPKDITPEEYGEGVGTYDGFYLKPSDKAAQRGFVIMNRLADTQTEGTPEGYKGIDIGGRGLEITTVNKLPAVRVTDVPQFFEIYWIYNTAKTKVVRVNIVAENDTELATYTQWLKTIQWL